MVWINFIFSATTIVVAAIFLAKYGDVIAARTRLGGMFIGILLLAGATSLPELLTSIVSVSQHSPNIAAGNLFGSNAFNMLMLAILDLTHHNQRILRSVAKRHALTGSLATLLIGLVLFFLVANIDIKLGWLGLDALLIMAAYIVSVRLIASDTKVEHKSMPEVPEGTPGLWIGLVGFLAAAGVLILITPTMVSSSTEIAAITGLGTTFIGTTLVALVTSLPEIVTTIAAIRIGANDMAVGNLFGSNMFNMFALGFTDLFHSGGRFLAAIDPSFILVATFGLLMTIVGLVGNLAKLERRLFKVELDSLVLFILYLSGMYLLFQRGMG
jgi:cation:H+ antiporter